VSVEISAPFKGADGFWYRSLPKTDQGGTAYQETVRVCEDCFVIIPNYVDFPRGLVSPESDGDAGGNFAKTRPTTVLDKPGLEHQQKIVCLPCYLRAFQRVYPGARVPKLNADVRGAVRPVEIGTEDTPTILVGE
jgi:hypothetical protein